jgi:hypothetical protein
VDRSVNRRPSEVSDAWTGEVGMSSTAGKMRGTVRGKAWSRVCGKVRGREVHATTAWRGKMGAAEMRSPTTEMRTTAAARVTAATTTGVTASPRSINRRHHA